MIRFPVSTLHRLSFATGVSHYPYTLGIMIESSKSGNVYAVASDSKILACENLGFSKVPIPQVILALPKSTAGDVVVMPGAAYIEQNGIPVEFFKFVQGVYSSEWKVRFKDVDEAKEKYASLAFDGEQIARLAKSSPSGKLVFPEYIGKHGCVVVNDWENSDWFGMFMTTYDKQLKQYIQPAAIPEWVR